jgi:hypothetical protein
MSRLMDKQNVASSHVTIMKPPITGDHRNTVRSVKQNHPVILVGANTRWRSVELHDYDTCLTVCALEARELAVLIYSEWPAKRKAQGGWPFPLSIRGQPILLTSDLLQQLFIGTWLLLLTPMKKCSAHVSNGGSVCMIRSGVSDHWLPVKRPSSDVSRSAGLTESLLDLAATPRPMRHRAALPFRVWNFGLH